MTTEQIIRAWKDAVYRNSLTPAELATLPSNPAGAIDLSDADLEQVRGGQANAPYTYGRICGSYTICCSTNWPRGLPC